LNVSLSPKLAADSLFAKGCPRSLVAIVGAIAAFPAIPSIAADLAPPPTSQYYQDYQSVVIPTSPASPSPSPLPPAPSTTTPLPPTTQPALTEPVWVMPTVIPTGGAIPAPSLNAPPAIAPQGTVIPQPGAPQPDVPRVELPPPPAVTRTAPGKPASPETAVLTTSVQITGVSPDLQDYGLQIIQTKLGGQTSSNQLQNDVVLLLNSGIFSSASVVTRPNAQGVDVTFIAAPTIVQALNLPSARALTYTVANSIFQDQFGKPISVTALNQAVQRLNAWYTQNGYTLARVLSVQPTANGILVIEVAEGAVGDVKIRYLNREGQAVDAKGQPIRGRSQETFIRRQIKIDPGQPFQVRTAREDLNRLNQLGIFEATSITFEGDARKTDIVYNLTERPPRDLRFGGGFNDTLGLYGTVGVQDNNFGGLGQRLGGNVLVGTKDVQFDGRFVSPYRDTEPNVPGYNANIYRQQGSSIVFDDKVDLPNGDRIRERRFGTGVGLEKPLGNGWQGFAGFNYANVSLRDSAGKVSPVDERGNPLSLSGTGIDDLYSFTFTALKEMRDNPVNPSSGSVIRLDTEQYIPIGRGEVFGTKLQANYAYFIPVKLITANQKTPPTAADGQPEVVALNVQGGTVVGDLPPYNAFVLGGPNSVRGWDTAHIGTSRSYIQATAEYRFPIYKFIGGTTFLDFASDLGTMDDVPGQPGIARDRPGTGFGGGFGLRINSPFGILRGDLGINNRGDVRFQFGFGQKF
jgi:outer membrane protein insertion porin family